MKKYLLLLAIPFTVFAESSYELYPSKECEALKADYTAQINEIWNLNGAQRVNLQGLSQQLIMIRSFGESVTNMENQAQGDFGAQSTSAAYATISYANASLENVSTMLDNNSTNTYRLGQLLTSVQNIDCGKCGSDSTNCCDFTDILDVLNEIKLDVHDTNLDVDYIQDLISYVIDWLEYISPTLDTGFGNVTNLLSDVLYHSSPTSRFGVAKDNTMNTSYQTVQKKNGRWDDASGTATWIPQGIGAATKISSFDMLKVITQNSGSLGTVVNRLAWIHDDFRNLTNEVATIHRDQTNYFSFFRGEIGVQGVLSDWQSEQVSGTYHDFLTNHYLTVVRGDPLSGNQSSKTNWFSRIETLLAALVFTDTTETNTVDSSVGESERSQISSAYMSANSSASSVSDDLKTTTQGIVELYRSYFETFDNAAMPSHVVLMRLQGTGGEEDVEISFSSDSLSILVEGCRIVTTLCWASVGIFLLYRFLVWSARCVILACQFIYRAISSVFKS